jgi:hypothetical protein
MTWDEFWGDFSESDYRARVKRMDRAEVLTEHAIARSKLVTAGASTGVGVGAAPFTLGFSLVGSAVGVRRARYNSKKFDILEERLAEEGWDPTRFRKRDFALAAGPTAVAAAVVPGAGHLVSHAIGHVAGHGAATFAAHHASDTISNAIAHPSAFGHAMEQGIHAQSSAVLNGLEGHATNLVPIDAIASNSPGFLGYVAGNAAANAAELKAVETAVEHGTKWTVGRGIREVS